MEGVMYRTRFIRAVFRSFLSYTAFLSYTVCLAAIFGAAFQAQAQQQAPSPAQTEARVIVTGEGSVSAPPDYVQIASGVTTCGKTAKEASDANSKIMAALITTLQTARIEQKDIQTSRFSIQPVYAPPQQNTEQRLTGFAVANQVTVTIRQTAKLGDVLDRLIAAGATDVDSVEFLHADLSKVLDQARVAAVADARRKAELYAHAAGLNLGPVVWMTEGAAATPPMRMTALAGGLAASPVPVSAGEDMLQARITVGFGIAP
jgi:uncharacterized protein YggE